MVMCHIDMNRIYRRMGISLYRSKEVGGDLDEIRFAMSLMKI